LAKVEVKTIVWNDDGSDIALDENGEFVKKFISKKDENLIVLDSLTPLNKDPVIVEPPDNFLSEVKLKMEKMHELLERVYARTPTEQQVLVSSRSMGKTHAAQGIFHTWGESMVADGFRSQQPKKDLLQKVADLDEKKEEKTFFLDYGDIEMKTIHDSVEFEVKLGGNSFTKEIADEMIARLNDAALIPDSAQVLFPDNLNLKEAVEKIIKKKDDT